LKKQKLVALLLSMILSCSIITGCSGGGDNSATSTDDTTAKAQDADEETQTTEDDVQAIIEKVEAMSEEEREEAFLKEAGSQRAVRINNSGAFCLGNMVLADVLGYYEEEGLETELIRGGTTFVETLSAGQVDLGGTHIAHILKPTTNGLDVAYLGACNTGCQTFYVLSDSDAASLADLSGGIVGVSGGIGGPGHNIVLTMLAADGLSQDDYQFKDFDASQLLVAMQNGEIAGALIPEQIGEKWYKEGAVKRIRSITFDEDFAEDVCCIWGVNGTYLKENPVTCYKLARAIAKADTYMEENTLEAVQLMMEQDWLSGDANYIAEICEPYDMDCTSEQTERTLRKTVNGYRELGIIDESIDTDTFMHTYWHPFTSIK